MKKILLLLGVAMIVCILGRVNTTIIEPVNGQIKLKKVEYAAPILKRICSCESWGQPDKEPRQFDDKGKVLLGSVDPRDIGACQIHLPVWQTAAAKLGYNLWTRAGNIAMANYIYRQNGTQPWNASKESCWAKT